MLRLYFCLVFAHLGFHIAVEVRRGDVACLTILFIFLTEFLLITADIILFVLVIELRWTLILVVSLRSCKDHVLYSLGWCKIDISGSVVLGLVVAQHVVIHGSN